MKGSVTKLWSSLTKALSSLPPAATAADYFSSLAAWVQEYSAELGPTLMKRYGLDALSSLNVGEFPTEYSQVEVEVEVRSLASQSPSSIEVVCMLVRDKLWELVAFKTAVPCPNCGEDELRALVDPGVVDRLVLACDFCGWAQLQDGTVWTGSPECRPATTCELARWGLLA
jgi:hypothetical protein